MINKRVEEMHWNGRATDVSWLELSAVGVLKSFIDESFVVKGLLNRNILFEFYYLGDKNVLWLFRSMSDRKSFIKNNDVWKDFFSSVGAWSPSITPQARLSWVEFRSVSLDCWCDDFFFKMGWAVGEPLLIDDEILTRNNLLRGRVLVLLPYSHLCPDYVKVVTGSSSFMVSVREVHEPISYSSSLQWLGLN
ncbi:hypothetical protein LWI28_009754 [Acer negundo]|uniref:Uncharacterized protein n=1 Tax=Acer negundo TaxID=4023 RepID=A0AAD5JML6_ACENE|nr:hypothetical protein LWI28_009754 [Acer negundo]